MSRAGHSSAPQPWTRQPKSSAYAPLWCSVRSTTRPWCCAASWCPRPGGWGGPIISPLASSPRLGRAPPGVLAPAEVLGVPAAVAPGASEPLRVVVLGEGVAGSGVLAGAPHVSLPLRAVPPGPQWAGSGAEPSPPHHVRLRPALVSL